MPNPGPPLSEEDRALAEAVRRACLEAALRAYEDAGVQGLCAEGRWEIAVAAMRGLDLGGTLRAEAGTTTPAADPPADPR